MKTYIKIIAVCAIAILTSGCANLQSAQTQQNLILTAKIACILEPSTTKLVGIFDTRKGTLININKVDEATRIACEALVAGTSK